MTVIAIGTLSPAPLVGPASWWPRRSGTVGIGIFKKFTAVIPKSG